MRSLGQRSRSCWTLHEEEEARSKAEVLGVVIDGELGIVKFSDKGCWKIYWAMREQLHLGRASGDDVRRFVGHLCYAFWLRRQSLCCLAACFRLIIDGVVCDQLSRRSGRQRPG